MDAQTIDRAVARELVPPRPEDAHKGRFGHLLVVAGSPGFTGAAALACEAGLRSGAGLVTLGIPQPLASIMAAKTMESMILALPATVESTLSMDAKKPIESFLSRATALAIGPGISTHPETADLLIEMLPTVPVPQVIDADGLNCLSRDPDALGRLPAETVLTPHPGEMARLTGLSTAEVQENRIDVARRWAGTWGVVVVLKGHRTVIAGPGGAVAVNSTGNSGMATGGSGDVLTGLLGGLLAQGMSPWDAARLAVYLHGLAGDIAADDLTPEAMIAGDMLISIADAWRHLHDEGA
jgi:hydroxyethylthiazole kinase-like uncharacterized protein yjeF